MKTVYRNYGNGSNFDPTLWKDPKNGGWIKPEIGGLWASPVDSKWGWKDWCEAEDFLDTSKQEYFDFCLSDDARVYTINTPTDIRIFKYAVSPFMSGYPILTIDFEGARKDYDAIFLSELGERTTRFSDPFSFYDWDCESILILNKEVIIC